MVTDPVRDGFVASLARPGGNITGFTIFEHSFAGKWLEMLKEVVPTMTRVAVLQNPDHPAWNAYQRAVGVIRAAYGRRSGAGAGEQSRRDHGGDRCLRTDAKRRVDRSAQRGRHAAPRGYCRGPRCAMASHRSINCACIRRAAA